MGLFDWLTAPANLPSHAPKPDRARELVLYKYDSCPYCQRVYRVLEELDLDVEMRDTRKDPAIRQELVSKTGRSQVPCLFIDDEPLFESADIVTWLRAYRAAV